MKEQRLEDLFRRYLQKSLTDAEEAELFRLWLDPLLEGTRVQIFNDFYDELSGDKDMAPSEANLVFEEIMKKPTPVHPLPAKTGPEHMAQGGGCRLRAAGDRIRWLLLFVKQA